VSNAKLTGEPSLMTGYIENCDKLRAILPPHESEQYLYMSAYVQLLSGPLKVSLARYEEAFTKFSRNPNASDSASALLEILAQRKEFSEVEKFVRLFMKLGIIPARDPNKDLPRVLERTVIDSAKLFFDSKKFDLAASRFMAFQKEFPLSALAPFALEKAGSSFAQINKIDQALTAYELYLKTYPKLPAAKDIRWSAAEMSATAKIYLKAAEHYQQFNILFPAEGVQKSASLKAAENFRLAAKYSDAVNEYEKYLKTVKAPAEQMRVLRLISASAVKASNGAVALNALERLSKLVRQPDEVIGVQFELMTVYQKLGRDDLSRKSAGVIVASKPSTPEGFKYQAKARFLIGRSDAPALRSRQIMSQKDLKVALQSLFTEYEKVKASLLSPCEIPGVDWCVLGYYEASRLAGDLGKMLVNVEPSNYLDENVVAEIKSLVSWNRDKMKSEARSFALQAEDALASSNLQEPEVVDKIKIYIEQVKSTTTEGEHSGESSAGGSDF
jgi:tetratricopeptide (TPR) repeat protein